LLGTCFPVENGMATLLKLLVARHRLPAVSLFDNNRDDLPLWLGCSAGGVLFESWAKFVEIHWATIKGDPLLIIVVACVFFSIGIGVAFFYHQGRVASLNGRIMRKDGELRWLNCLSLMPVRSVYSKLPNQDLRSLTLSLVTKIRDYLERASREMHDRPREVLNQAKDVKGTEEVVAEIRIKYRAEYEKTFHAETILIRDELLSRLSHHGKDLSAFGRYGNFDLYSIRTVVTALERMAKILPDD
jgi:hypothetical protein